MRLKHFNYEKGLFCPECGHKKVFHVKESYESATHFCAHCAESFLYVQGGVFDTKEANQEMNKGIQQVQE